MVVEIIERKDISLDNLRKIKCTTNSEANLYSDGDILYKMYRNVNSKVVQRKMFKLLILNDGDNLKDVVIPDIMILDNSLLYGCGMDYIYDAIPVYKFTEKSKDIYKFLKLVRNISLSLRKIHNDPRDIVVGDLNFNNIIFDRYMNHYFVDFDSSMVDGINADRIPAILNLYAKRRGNYKFEINQETDRLSMLLSTLYMLFSKQIDYVTMNEYDEKAEKLEILRDMRKMVLEIKSTDFGIPNVPYLDEFIPSDGATVSSRIKNIRVKNI